MNFKSSLRFLFIAVISVASYMMYSKSHMFMFMTTTNNQHDLKFEKSRKPNFDPFVLEGVLPDDPRFNPTIANGYLGHRLYGHTVYMNGLYNGFEGDSHRARIPGTLPYLNHAKPPFITKVMHGVKKCVVPETDRSEPQRITYDNEMDMKKGVFTQRIFIREIGKEAASVTQKFYAHKLVTRLLVTEITLTLHMDGHLVVPLRASSGNLSQDINFKPQPTTLGGDEKLLRDYKYLLQTRLLCGKTVVSELAHSERQSVCVMFTTFPESLTLDSKRSQTFTYITSIAEKAQEAQRFYMLGVHMLRRGTLHSSHQKEWEQQWSGGSALLDSDIPFQSHLIVSALYYLLSAFPPPSVDKYPYEYYGVSPGGLTNGGKNEDYLGHVFWDQDFWILPALLPLYPELVKQGLKYRVSKLHMARRKAAENGYDGAMYPWESAYTGADVCPGEKYVRYEQHVTGDLIHTLRQYIYLTEDWDFFSEKIPTTKLADMEKPQFHTAWDMLLETAMFWVSRASWNETNSGYDINAVMGPDEYHSPINNSVFTNVVAAQNIVFAIEVAKKLGKTIPQEKMQVVADGLRILYDKKLDYHPEYEGFNPVSDKVKQADAIMLGYPLMFSGVTSSSQRNDLCIYEKITDPEGPAMTWSMFGINWMMLQEYDKADEQFFKQFDNVHSPFLVWSEEASGNGTVNFLTGIGGYLQSIFYGYLGLQIHHDHAVLHPRLPPLAPKKSSTSRLYIEGFKLKSVILNIDVCVSFYTVELVGFSTKSYHVVKVTSGSQTFMLSNIGEKALLTPQVQCKINVM